MKYSIQTYGKALAEVVAEAKGKNPETIVVNFLKLIQKNGDEAHLRQIVEEGARYARRNLGIRKVTVESARKLSSAQEAEINKFIKSGDIVEEKIDPELIAGIRIILNDELQFDGSLRGKLEKIFSTT